MADSKDRGAELKEGDKVGDYEVRELIGEGPIGRVYKVLDTRFEVLAALKVLHPHLSSDKNVSNSVVDVFQGLSEFEADGHAKVFGAGKNEGKTWIAVDYLEGLSVRRLMEVRSGSGSIFKWEEAEPIIDAVCMALEQITPGEIHGDLKPENVVILPDAVRLTDYGLARSFDPGKFVSEQVVAGNAYMAPELADNPERIRIDPAVDVYALGAMLYQLLTGRLPTATDVIPSKLVKDVPQDIDAAVAKALSPDPDKRFIHPAEFHLALARSMGKPEIAARVEIFLHGLPEREPFAKAAPPEPTPPSSAETRPDAAPVRPSKSLFDDDILDATGSEAKPKAGSIITKAEPEKNKTPMILVAAAVVMLVAAAGGFFLLGGEKDDQVAKPAAVGAKSAKPAAAVSKADAEKAISKAEKTREEAYNVDAPKTAPDLFVAGMKSLKEADEMARAKRYAAAVTAAESAQDSFSDAVVEGIGASSRQAAKIEKAEKAEAKVAKAERAKVAAAVAAKEKEPCPRGMVLVPAGSFVMGSPSSDPDRNPGEKYNEQTSTGTFCIDEYEHANRKGKKPVANVSWYEARKMCADAGKRLCQEDEWEKACKGPRNLKFPYGASFNANACVTENAAGDDRRLMASGSASSCKSGYGVYDMSGNLWEWTASRLQPNMKDMVLRGGSYSRPDYHDRCANRYNSQPSVKDAEFGFRCCQDANQ